MNLRITEKDRDATSVAIRVEGRMTGVLAGLLEGRCREIALEQRSVYLDLSAVSEVDTQAIKALRRLVSAGVQLERCPALIRELIEEAE